MEVVNDVTQINEGTVAVEDAVPVDPVHILTPIVARHQAPVFIKHLTPFSTRIDSATQPRQVDADASRIVVINLVR